MMRQPDKKGKIVHTRFYDSMLYHIHQKWHTIKVDKL